MRTWGQHTRQTRREGWAAGGVGGGLSPPQGGTRSPAPARRPCPAAVAIGVRARAAGVIPSWDGTSGLPFLGPRTTRRDRKGCHRIPRPHLPPPPGPAPSRPRRFPSSRGSSGPTIRAGPAPILQPRHWRPLAAGLGLCAHTPGPGPASRPVLRGSLGRELSSRPTFRSDFGPTRPSSEKPSYKAPKEGVVCGSGPLESLGGPSPAHRRWQRLDNP